MKLDQNLLFSFALAQGGEFAFVLFSFAVQSKVLTSQEAAPLIASAALTMALTPLLMILNERLIRPRFGTRETADREPDEIDQESAVIVAGFSPIPFKLFTISAGALAMSIPYFLFAALIGRSAHFFLVAFNQKFEIRLRTRKFHKLKSPGLFYS